MPDPNISMTSLKCPNCQAPLPHVPGAKVLVCQYCNTPVRIVEREENPDGTCPARDSTGRCLTHQRLRIVQFHMSANRNAHRQAEGIKIMFDVFLQDPGIRKIAVIKAINATTGLGLADAKELVEESDAGTLPTVGWNVSQSEADRIKEIFEEAGALVSIVKRYPTE